MTYCLSLEVANQLGLTNDYSATTNPTKTYVDNLISMISAEIDIHLISAGITLPITNVSGLNFIKLNCIFGVAGVGGLSRFTNNNTVDNSQPEFYLRRYNDFLLLIDDKPEIIGTAIGDTGSDAVVSSNVLDGTYTEEEVNSNALPFEVI